MVATGFKDNYKQEIYSGDIVMYRLGKYAMKSSGPQNYKVLVTKKGVYLFNTVGDEWVKLRPLRTSDCEYITIIDKSERE